MSRLKVDEAPPKTESRDGPPGQFVSDEHEADCLRFLEQVKELARRRRAAGLGRAR